MVAITSGKLLITGGSGYLGAWIVKCAVDRGYSVLAAVSYVLVPVIEKDGAYDDAVKDVDAIIHAASPVIFHPEDPQDVLRPAIRGVQGILESTHKYGKNVKRIVLTSSVAAIGEPTVRDGKPIRDEVNGVEYEGHCRSRGPWKGAQPMSVYAASKVYAEQSAWAWVKEHKPSWDLVTILPPYVLGTVHPSGKETHWQYSAVLLEYTLDHPDTSGATVGTWADVRDTANIHILALEHPDAAGERVLIGSEAFAWQDVYDIFNSVGFPNINAPGKATRGAGKTKQCWIISNAKEAKLWPDLRYHTFESSIRPLGEQLVEDGYLTVEKVKVWNFKGEIVRKAAQDHWIFTTVDLPAVQGLEPRRARDHPRKLGILCLAITVIAGFLLLYASFKPDIYVVEGMSEQGFSQG
ncbi:hypothetical protein BS47DRAFT_1359630 [Hydnum rufescens UP504]|uniref:NAD-dependent epimerase/dehydratase domain-containing protein n=1 Tax=Hydnum rufescens UP504 TaxID=1448309 RepID=A0A9P6B5J4_9AGAM|nr:hypothetical protein BS47DRAFT_1359630 [Hydnum rufescens UP504]